jgi:hypothetical protein
MLGILYLMICIAVGSAFCGIFFPNLRKLTDIPKGDGTMITLPRYFVMLPAWFLTGTLFVTWTVYLSAYIFKGAEKPLIFGDSIGMSLGAVFFGLWLLFGVLRKEEKKDGLNLKEFFFSGNVWYNAFSAFTILFVGYLMYLTFNVSGRELNVGISVFSDFAPHMGMIRSFSVSDNFPTQYAHFAGEDIKYHFMFQFLAGNLEFLGLRIDHAFNVPSIISMVSVYHLLFVLTMHLLKSRLTAWLGALFFTFRSSFSVFRYMAEYRGKDVFKMLRENTQFLAYTTHEDWGLWNLNVYCNQRHLCFGITAILLAILLFLPYLTDSFKTLEKVEKGQRFGKIRTLFFCKEAFWVLDVKASIGAGLFLGSLAFFHGSALIAAIAMLFFMAAFSRFKIDYLITALIAMGMSFLQTNFFMDDGGIGVKYQFGFIAENTTPSGVVGYIFALTGIVLLLTLLGACLTKGAVRYMCFVFAVPFIMSFTLAVTDDVTVNHKWVMISLMLLSMYAAHFVTYLLKEKAVLQRVLAVILIICMTATGFYEFTIVQKKNENYIKLNLDDPVTMWIEENATTEDMFLTSWYSLSNVVMGGAMLYYGWPYYAWSAGYDTNYRGQQVALMYEASSPVELSYLVAKNKIDYIIVDNDVRTNSEYDVREDVIEETFKEVFSQGEGDWQFRIFDTHQPLDD